MKRINEPSEIEVKQSEQELAEMFGLSLDPNTAYSLGEIWRQSLVGMQMYIHGIISILKDQDLQQDDPTDKNGQS